MDLTARSAIERRVSSVGLLVAALLLIALAFRLYNVNWDQSQHLHPDERHVSTVLAELRQPSSVSNYFDSEQSGLNPYNHKPTFVYGTLPLFLTKGVAEWLDRDKDGTAHHSGQIVLEIVESLGGEPHRADGSLVFDGGYNANIVGRVLSALADTATVLVTFFLGRAAVSRLVGLLGATFVAFAPLHIQQSHFFTSDSFLVLFVTLCLYTLVVALRRKRGWPLVLAGLLGGLAVGCKVSGVLLVAPLTVAAAISLFPGLRSAWDSRSFRAGLRAAGPWVGWWVLAIGAALLVFRLVQPYAFANDGFLNTFAWNLESSDFRPSSLLRGEPLYPQHYLSLDKRFVDDLTNLRETQAGADFPPNAQWIGRTPFLWPSENIVKWGFGPFASLSALIGLVVSANLLRRRALSPGAALIISWCALVTLVYGNDFVATMRYFLPVYPGLAVLGGLGVAALVSRATESRRSQYVLALSFSAAAVLLIGSVAYGAAFTSGVYGSEISRIEATRWMLSELPAGTVISHENWDDGLPLQPPGFPNNPFRTVDLDLYGTDSREKVIRFADQLDQIEVIVLSSNRLAGSIPRHPARYPSTTRYYQSLDDGSLGFEKVAEFQNGPGLFGLSWSDASAEEAFTVYDHPPVTLYRKTAAYSRENTLRILQPDRADAAVSAPPGDAATNSLMLSSAAYAKQQSGGTWTEVFSPHGVFAQVPWLWWILWLELSAIAVLPWWTWLCRAAPDRAYGVAKVAGPLLAALVAWIAVAWGPVTFSRELAWASLAALAGLGAAVGWRRRLALRTEWRELKGTWIATELVFIGVFAFFLLLRAANPDLWYHPTGGEKPMEVAYFTAVVRSSELPPYDPWLAGGYLNYYYFGWFILAVPTRALQIVPEVAFNLGVPTFASLAAAASFSCVAGMVAGVRNAARRIPPWVGGAIAVFLSVYAGNLDAAHQTIERLQRISTWHPTSGFKPLDGLGALVGGAYASLVSGTPMATFDWWRSSRVHFGTSDITEFPYWSFLFADLHPHLMAIPLFIAIAAVASVYVQTCLAGFERRAWALVAALGVLVGVIRMAHTWDLPTAVLLAIAAVSVGRMLSTGSVRRRLATFVGHGAVVGAVAQLVAQPYLAHSAVFNQGVIRSPETTPPQQFFTHFGIFLAVGGLYVLIRHVELVRLGTTNSVARFLGRGERFFAATTLLVVVFLIAQESGYGVVAAGTAGAVIVANLAWVEVRERHGAPQIMAAVFLLIGLVVAVSVDLVTVKDDIGRMNTVFKFSLQAWHLLALGSAFGVVYAVTFVRQELASRPGIIAAAGWRIASRGVAVALLCGLLFPVMATGPRQEARFADLPATLDGLRYLESDPTFVEQAGSPGPQDDPTLHLAEDLPLIEWLRANVEGSPTIVEEVGPLYHWTGRYSINTGLPTVIGWDWHQIQQRGIFAAQVGERRQETHRFYTDPDPEAADRFLRRYDVAYVIVGPWERALGTPQGVAKFGTMPALEEVFRFGDNVIYQVDKAALQFASGSGS